MEEVNPLNPPSSYYCLYCRLCPHWESLLVLVTPVTRKESEVIATFSELSPDQKVDGNLPMENPVLWTMV